MSGPAFFLEDGYGEQYRQGLAGSIEYNGRDWLSSNDNVFQIGIGSLVDAIILIKLIQGSLILSFLIVAYAQYYIFNNSPEDDVKPKVIEFKDKYPIESATQDKNEDGSNKTVNPSSFVMEFTPNGIVIMTYSYEDEAFVYWSNKNVTFANLETVGRKFVTQMCARDLYIDRRGLLENKKQKIIDEIEENNERIRMSREEKENGGSGGEGDGENGDEDDYVNVDGKTVNEPEKEENNVNSVFATFKSYNTTKGKSEGKLSTNKKTDEIQEIDEEKIMKGLTVDTANKYIRRGVVKDFEISKIPEEPEPTKEKPLLDFSTFKRLFLSSQDD